MEAEHSHVRIKFQMTGAVVWKLLAKWAEAIVLCYYCYYFNFLWKCYFYASYQSVQSLPIVDVGVVLALWRCWIIPTVAGLDCHWWRSQMPPQTKLHLYSVYIQPWCFVDLNEGLLMKLMCSKQIYWTSGTVKDPHHSMARFIRNADGHCTTKQYLLIVLTAPG